MKERNDGRKKCKTTLKENYCRKKEKLQKERKIAERKDGRKKRWKKEKMEERKDGRKKRWKKEMQDEPKKQMKRKMKCRNTKVQKCIFVLHPSKTIH
jgi:5'-3' exonuclease